MLCPFMSDSVSTGNWYRDIMSTVMKPGFVKSTTIKIMQMFAMEEKTPVKIANGTGLPMNMNTAGLRAAPDSSLYIIR